MAELAASTVAAPTDLDLKAIIAFVKQVQMAHSSIPGHEGIYHRANLFNILYPTFASLFQFTGVRCISLAGVLGPAIDLRSCLEAEAWVKGQLLSGELDAVLETATWARLFVHENCNDMVVAKDVVFGESVMTMVFQQADIQLANDWKAAMLRYKNSPAYSLLLRHHLKIGMRFLFCFEN